MLGAHDFLADLARRLSHDPAPFEERARSIRAAMQQKLWQPRAGVFAEYLDTRGERLLHPEPELPTIYHTAEFGAADPVQVYEMLHWVDTHLRHETTPNGGTLVWSSNWFPNRGRSYTHSTFEMAYGEELNLALTHYLVGQADDAYAIIRATLCGIFNGPTPGGLSCHAYTRGLHGGKKDHDWMAADPLKLGGYFFRGQYEIHGPGRNGAPGHTVVFCGLFVLGQDDPALGLYGPYTLRTVGAGPRKDDTDGIRSLVLGKGPEKGINRHMLGMGFAARQEPQLAVENGQLRIGRNDIYMIGFHGHAVLYLTYRHGRRF